MAKSLLALFLLLTVPQFASAQNSVAEANSNTVGIVSGGVGGTYVQFAQNMMDVLDDNALRVVAVLGRGSQQNIRDLRFLKGIDAAIVQSDVLEHFQTTRELPDIDEKIGYITKLYNEEIHLLVRNDINSIQDLAGKPVSFAKLDSGTSMTSEIIFDNLGVNPKPVYLSGSESLAALKRGVISGAVFVAGKPHGLTSSLNGREGIKLLPIPLTPRLSATYLEGTFDSSDYPNLVQPGQQVGTISVGAVLAVFNWKNSGATKDRYQRTSRFIDALFSSLPKLQTNAYHPKWQEVNLYAPMPGWKRFPAATNWLQGN